MARKTKFIRTNNFVIMVECEKNKRDADACISITSPYGGKGIQLSHYAWCEDHKEREGAVKEAQQVIDALILYIKELNALPEFPDWKEVPEAE